MDFTWKDIHDNITYSKLLNIEPNSTYLSVFNDITKIFPIPLQENINVYYEKKFIYHYDPKYYMYIKPETILSLITHDLTPTHTIHILRGYLSMYHPIKIHLTYIDDHDFLANYTYHDISTHT